MTLRALLGVAKVRSKKVAKAIRLFRDLAKLYAIEAREKGIRGPDGKIKPDRYLMLCARDIYRRMKELEERT